MIKKVILLIFCALILSSCQKPVPIDTQKVTLEVNDLVKSCIMDAGNSVVKSRDISYLDNSQMHTFINEISLAIEDKVDACVQTAISGFAEKNIEVLTKVAPKVETRITPTDIQVLVFYPVTIKTREKFPTIIEISEFVEQFEPYGIYLEVIGSKILAKKSKTFLNVHRDEAFVFEMQSSQPQRTVALKVVCQESCDIGKEIIKEQEIIFELNPGLYVRPFPVELASYNGTPTIRYTAVLKEAQQTIDTTTIILGHSER